MTTTLNSTRPGFHTRVIQTTRYEGGVGEAYEGVRYCFENLESLRVVLWNAVGGSTVLHDYPPRHTVIRRSLRCLKPRIAKRMKICTVERMLGKIVSDASKALVQLMM